MALEAPKRTVLAEDGRDSLDDTGGDEIPGPASGQRAARDHSRVAPSPGRFAQRRLVATAAALATGRSEEHTSELQSQSNLVCRLLLEKKKKTKDSELVYRYSYFIFQYPLQTSS